MTAIDYTMIPGHCRDGMKRYIERGVPPGSFLNAVLENNLVEAIGRADDINQHCLRDYALFLFNEAPSYPVRCWGSREAVENWQRVGGLQGLQSEQARKTA